MDTAQQQPAARPHQIEAAERILAALEANRQRILVLMPMGTGRTGVATLLVTQLAALQRDVVIVAQSRNEIEQVRHRIRTITAAERGNVHFHTLGELAQAAVRISRQSAQPADSPAEPDPRIAGRVVISINTSLGRILHERTRAAEALQSASAIIGFTALATIRDIEIYGEPVYNLHIDEAFERRILARPSFLSTPAAPLGERPDHPQVRAILEMLPPATREGRCVFVCASPQAGALFYEALTEYVPDILITRIAAEQSQAQRQAGLEAQWIVMSSAMTAGMHVPDVQHLILLDKFGFAVFLRAVQFAFRPSERGSATIVDFGGNQQEWERLGQSSDLITALDEDEHGEAEGGPAKWIRPHADGAASHDLMRRHQLINVLLGIIKSKSDHRSLAIGLFGRWGSGKSTIINLLKKRIGRTRHIAVIEFNAWENEHASSMPAALADAVTQQIHQQHPPLQRFWLIVKHRVLNNDTGASITLLVLIVLLTFMAPIEKLDDKMAFHDFSPLDDRIRVWITAAVTAFFAIQVMWKSPFVQGLRSLAKRIGYAEHIGLARRLRDDLEGLFKAADYRLRDRLPGFMARALNIAPRTTTTYVVVVDDLDRCTRQNVWSVVEATRLIAQFEQVVLIFAVDYRLLFDAVAERLQEKSAQGGDSERLSREFLAKILQLSVQLPEPTDEAVERFIADALFKVGVAALRAGPATVRPVSSDDAAVAQQPALADPPPAATSASDDAPEDEALPLEVEYLASTPEQAQIFHECARAFGITNPRSLLRLYNSVTLIKGMHPEVGEHTREYRRHTFHIFLTELFAAHDRRMIDAEACLRDLAAAGNGGGGKVWRSALDYAGQYDLLVPQQAAANQLALQRAWTTSLPVLH